MWGERLRGGPVAAKQSQAAPDVGTGPPKRSPESPITSRQSGARGADSAHDRPAGRAFAGSSGTMDLHRATSPEPVDDDLLLMDQLDFMIFVNLN
ncbi:hypothetical protein HJFPF1_06238 [Paramyrothecium foliicola]|nr:hypothetical protein HJFPF1_06238 [Paramyrothecium foliicola]